MTDLRTELEGILTEVADTAEYAVDDIANGEMEQGEGKVVVEQAITEALTAIEKLIEDRYVDRSDNKLIFMTDEYAHKTNYITRQEAYEKCCDSLDLPIAVQPYGEERYKTWKALRTAFNIPEGKE